MRRICHVGIAHNDRRAKVIVENLGEVGGVCLIPLTLHPTDPPDTHLKPDIIIHSFNSHDELMKKKPPDNRIPVVLVGELYGRKGERSPENFYFSSPNPLNLNSILKALLKGMDGLKVELKNGAVINLLSSLSGSYIEKLFPTGKKKRIFLSFKEGVILKELFKEPGEIIPYDRFIQLGIKKENIPVYMSRLRKVVSGLESLLVIKSLRGKGYFVYYGL